MDCEQVFIILTRGPFPTGESWDEQVIKAIAELE